MIGTFILAAALALVSFRLGAANAINTLLSFGLALLLILAGLGIIYLVWRGLRKT